MAVPKTDMHSNGGRRDDYFLSNEVEHVAVLHNREHLSHGNTKSFHAVLLPQARLVRLDESICRTLLVKHSIT